MNQQEIDALVKQSLQKYGLESYYEPYKKVQATRSVVSRAKPNITKQQEDALVKKAYDNVTSSYKPSEITTSNTEVINKLAPLLEFDPKSVIQPSDITEDIPSPFSIENQFSMDNMNVDADFGTQFDLNSFVNQYNNKVKEYDKLQNEALDLQKDLAKQEEERQKLYDEYNIDDKTTQLNSLVNQLNTLKTSAQAKKLLVEGRLAPMQAIAGEQAAIDRSTAVQALTIGAQIDALKSEITASLDKIDRAINIKYEGIRQQIKIKQYQLDILEKQLDRMNADKRSILSMLLEEKRAKLKQQEQEIELEAQEEKDKQLMVLNAMVNGAPQWLIAKLNQAKSTYEVIQLGGKYVVSPKDLAYIRNSYKSSSESRVRPLSPNELAKLYEIGYTANPGDTIYDATKIEAPQAPAQEDNKQSWLDKLLSWVGLGTKTNEIEELRNY